MYIFSNASYISHVNVCVLAEAGEVIETESSEGTSYIGRIVSAWNQLRIACARDFSQGAAFLRVETLCRCAVIYKHQMCSNNTVESGHCRLCLPVYYRAECGTPNLQITCIAFWGFA